MGSAPLPPSMAGQAGEFGPGTQPASPMQVSPAPPTPVDPKLVQVGQSVRNIQNELKVIAESFPTTLTVIQDINSKMQELQQKVIQSLPPMEPAAPPV